MTCRKLGQKKQRLPSVKQHARDSNPEVPGMNPSKASTCPGRLKFACDHVDDLEEDWENIMWSDETNVEVFGTNSICHDWRETNAELHPKNTIPTVKHRGLEMSCFMVVFSAKGTGRLTSVKERMNEACIVRV